ncbi:hypothetical protein ACFE04_014275 [Oxalis oulophora]
MLGVAGVFGGSLFSAMHGSLVTSSLIRETTENESANEGYRFGQEEETYNIVAAHGYFGRLIFQYASFNNSRSLHFFLAAWPVVGIWFTALGINTMAFNLNGFNFNQSVVDSQDRFEEAAQIFRSKDQVVFAKVNAVHEKLLAAKLEISCFSTFIIFKDKGKEVHKYQGPSDAKGMADCLERLRVPLPVVALDDLTKLGQDKKNNVIVGYFPKFSGRDHIAFGKAAKEFKWDYDFSCTKSLPDDDAPVVRLLNPFLSENKIIPFETKDFNIHSLVNFVKNATTPDVIDYDVHPPQLVAKFFCGQIDNDKVMLLIDRNGPCPSAIETKYCQLAMRNREFAMRNEGPRITFMLGSFEARQDALQFFKLHKSAKAPLIAIRTTKGETFWKEKLEFEDDIEAFMGKYKENKLSIPPENIGPVNVEEIVADNFQKVVNGKNVFLALGPWCDDCKALAQVLDGVDTHFKSKVDDNVVIAKLYNNYPEIRSKGLYDDPYAAKDCPSLHFKRASAKIFTVYHGPKTAKDYIIKFIEINSDVAKPVKMESLGDIIKLIGGKKIVIVGFFPEFSGKKYENFIEAGHKLSWGNFFDFRTLDAKHHPDGGRDPVVRLFTSRKNEENFAETSNLDVDALVEFVKDKSTPAVIEYGEHPQLFEHNFFYGKNKKVMLFINRSDESAHAIKKQYCKVSDKYIGQDKKQYREFADKYRRRKGQDKKQYCEVADKYRGQKGFVNMFLNTIINCGLSFMIGDLEASQDAYRYFNLEKSQEPFIVFMNHHRDVYVKEHLMSGCDIEGLVKHFKEHQFGSYSKLIDLESNDVTGTVKKSKEGGNVANYKQSLRPFPESRGHVRTGLYFDRTGLYFDLTVSKRAENILLVLYGDSWLHSGTLMSVLDDVAFHLKKINVDLNIAMVSRWQVDCPDSNIQNTLAQCLHCLKTHFDDDEPTLFYFNGHGRKDIVPYEGDITGGDIICFIVENKI